MKKTFSDKDIWNNFPAIDICFPKKKVSNIKGQYILTDIRHRELNHGGKIENARQ